MENKISFSLDRAERTIGVSLSADSNLEQVLDAFEDFLRAAGYQFTGEITVVRDDPLDAERGLLTP